MLEAIWLYCKNMQNLENLDVFEILITQNFDYTKSAKMPEGPFCQIGAHIYIYLGFYLYSSHAGEFLRFCWRLLNLFKINF